MYRVLYEDLCQTFDRIPIIDTHEHLPQEAARLKQHVDFSTLFSHYCYSDFYSAGMSDALWNELMDEKTDLKRKWDLFSRYYPLVKDTSYTRSARIAMQRFYQHDDLQSFRQAEEVTRQIQEANQPGLFDKVLKQACHLEHSFLFTNESAGADPEGFFQYVDSIDHYCGISSRRGAEFYGNEMGGAYETVDQYAETIFQYMKDKAARGVRGIKYALAYGRTLQINPTSRQEAIRLWERMPSANPAPAGETALTREEALALQDYFLRKTLEFCAELHLPAVFHTGIHAGARNVLKHSDPLLLDPIVREFSGVTFVLLHCGIPWTEQAAILAKYFQNVYVDMAWLHIVSPEIAVRGLKAWMDLLPANKILGFGGDYLVVEKVYGHLQIARENLCRALAEKVCEQGLSADRAHFWLHRMLHDNAQDVYFPERSGSSSTL